MELNSFQARRVRRLRVGKNYLVVLILWEVVRGGRKLAGSHRVASRLVQPVNWRVQN